MTTQKLESISDLQKFLQAIYGEKNRKLSFEYIYSFASHNCAYLARSIEKNSNSDPYFISSFSWICALGTHLNINLEEAFYRKFPNCCPYCLERVCICLSSGKTALKFKNQRAAKAERENHYRATCQIKQELSKTAKTLNSIYPSNRAIWTIHSHHYQFSRLFEELGEIYEAYCLYKTNGDKYLTAISEEIADCIAWLLSAWDIKNPEKPFTDAFLSYYSQDCPACIKSPCECKDHYAKNKSLHSEQDLNKLLDSLKKLSEALKIDSSKSDSIESALKIIETATKELQESTKDTTSDIKATINRNDSNLSKAKDLIFKTPEFAEKFNSLFAAYEAIKNSLPWL
jgi:hypothetical protein